MGTSKACTEDLFILLNPTIQHILHCQHIRKPCPLRLDRSSTHLQDSSYNLSQRSTTTPLLAHTSSIQQIQQHPPNFPSHYKTMPVNWKDPKAFERLIAAVIAAHDLKVCVILNYGLYAFPSQYPQCSTGLSLHVILILLPVNKLVECNWSKFLQCRRYTLDNHPAQCSHFRFTHSSIFLDIHH